MIGRSIAASVPFRWVAGDTVYGGPAEIEQDLRRAGKGYVLGVDAPMSFDRGTSRSRSPAPPRPSPKHCRPPTGDACQREQERKGRACMTGATSNWLTSRRKRSTMKAWLVDARPADLGAISPMAISPTSPHGARQAHRSRRWSASRAIRWAIEDSFETAKNEFGPGPQRDQVLAWLASSRLTRHAPPSP